jgi:hypothetical protein
MALRATKSDESPQTTKNDGLPHAMLSTVSHLVK